MLLPKSKVDLYAATSRDARTGMSLRALMRKYGAGFETVQRALVSVVPQPRKKMRPRETRLDPYRPVIGAILTADLTAPRKQRHTVKRIYDRLLDEHDAVDISYQMVRAYVAGRREEIRLQAGKRVVDAFVPQTHKPGAEAEVDFGDVTGKLAGELVTCYLFAFRLAGLPHVPSRSRSLHTPAADEFVRPLGSTSKPALGARARPGKHCACQSDSRRR